MKRSSSFTMQDVKLIGRKEATSFGHLLAYSNGTMMATLQRRGQSVL